MKTKLILSILLLMTLPLAAQTKAVLKTPATNALTESLVVPTGLSITVNSGGSIVISSGATISGLFTAANEILYGGTAGATTRLAMGTNTLLGRTTAGVTALNFTAFPQLTLSPDIRLLGFNSAGTLGRISTGSLARWNPTLPTAPTDNGDGGQFAYDGDYLYFHNGTEWIRFTGTNSW